MAADDTGLRPLGSSQALCQPQTGQAVHGLRHHLVVRQVLLGCSRERLRASRWRGHKASVDGDHVPGCRRLDRFGARRAAPRTSAPAARAATAYLPTGARTESQSGRTDRVEPGSSSDFVALDVEFVRRVLLTPAHAGRGNRRGGRPGAFPPKREAVVTLGPMGRRLRRRQGRNAGGRCGRPRAAAGESRWRRHTRHIDGRLCRMQMNPDKNACHSRQRGGGNPRDLPAGKQRGKPTPPWPGLDLRHRRRLGFGHLLGQVDDVAAAGAPRHMFQNAPVFGLRQHPFHESVQAVGIGMNIGLGGSIHRPACSLNGFAGQLCSSSLSLRRRGFSALKPVWFMPPSPGSGLPASGRGDRFPVPPGLRAAQAPALEAAQIRFRIASVARLSLRLTVDSWTPRTAAISWSLRPSR